MKDFPLNNPLLTQEQYDQMYAESFANKEQFWSNIAKEQVTWFKDFTKVKNTNYEGDVSIKWFEDGELNVCYNCVDRHAEQKPNDTAIIWEGDDPSQSKTYTYKELQSEVSRFANVLKKLGVKKGDRVTIYLTMIPEVAFAMLACTRIGAIHSVIFGGFAPESIAGRIQDCQSQFVITADEGLRGGKTIPLKSLPKINFPSHFIGHLDDDSLVNLYSAADATIIPSRQEAFCQTASESQACGTPVVAFNIGGLIDIVDHFKTGYLAKAFDTEDLSKGISWVLEKKQKSLLSKQARSKAVEKFSQKILIEKYQAIYEKVLNDKI